MGEQQLIKGFKDRVLVNKVEESFEKFNSKIAPYDLVYCHKVEFELTDGATYPGQVCASHPVAPFMINDILDIEIKSFTKGIYTFDIHKITPGEEPDMYVRGKERPTPRLTTSYLNGSPGEIALRYAVMYHQYRQPSTNADVLNSAKEFKEFIINNAN